MKNKTDKILTGKDKENKAAYNSGFSDGVRVQQDIIEKEYQEQLKDCKEGRHGDTKSGGFGKPDICTICGQDL